jgi:D-3-phosphoglycerate dehydrogenase
MPLVLISGEIHDDGRAILRARPDVTVEDLPDGRPETFLARLPEADGLLLRMATLPREALVSADRLKIVSRHGVGYDNVPVDALTAKGIPLAVVGAVHSGAVAEHAMYLILALAKSALRHDGAVRGGDWDFAKRLESVELAGRALLIIGFGRIGRELARRAAAFDMRILAYDPQVPAEDMAAVGVTRVPSWRIALGEADFVSLHVPRLPATEGMIGAAELAAMKPTAFLINTARGGLVGENALAEALAAGTIAGAGLDTFETEPPPDHPLFSSDRVILSPHIAGLTKESAARIAVAAAENVLAGIDGTLDPLLVINPSVLKRNNWQAQ